MSKSGKQPVKSKGGRIEGDPGRKIVDIALQAAVKGITPVEVMLLNMRFAHEKAEDLFTRLVAISEGKLDRGAKDGDDVVKPEPIDMFREMLRFKNLAQECARDVAPYIHPKYATITLKGDEDAPVQIGLIRRTIVRPGQASSGGVRPAS